MVSKRKTYTREFKVETVNLLMAGEQSVSQMAQDLEIHPNTLYKWVRQCGQDPAASFPGKGKQAPRAGPATPARKPAPAPGA